MKKRLVALITILLLVTSLSLSTFAANGFNKAVFNNVADVTVKADDMTGDAIFATTSLLGADGEISVGDGETVVVYGAISANSSFDLFRVVIQYYADDWAYIDGFIVKIGNKSYVFSDVESNGEVASDGTIRESTGITVDSSTVPLMRELIEHRNEEIKVRLCGDEKNIEFVLTDAMKDSIINLYNLFVAAGGTRSSNMKCLDTVREGKMEVRKIN